MAGPDASPEGPLLGQRYLLDRELARGPAGTLFSARHQLLGHAVTARLVPDGLAGSATEVADLLREAREAGALRHAHIAEVVDCGRDAQHGVFLVLEHLAGRSLAAALLEDGPFPSSRALPLLRQLAQALQVAHAAGLVHGAVTLHSVFLCASRDGSERVKLLDFGLSHLGPFPPLTEAERTVGGRTPYLAPEQWGETRATDPRVDAFAFGVVAHALLTGHLPGAYESTPAGENGADRDAASLLDTSVGQHLPEVAQLIAECLALEPGTRPSSFAEVAQRLVSGSASSPDDNEDEELAGTMAGSYRLVRLLGSGAIGSVWLGMHPVIGSKVAVKILHRHMCQSPDVVRRFAVEAQAVNRMQSPYVVKIFDFGKLPDGRDYAVMELLEGETLGSWLLREGPLPWEDALPLVAQIASALAVAHQVGVVHRDLKPFNVFLCAEEDDVRVKVLDFGIAKLLDDEGQSAFNTRAGICLGTPAYAAPEQLVPDGDVGPAADIYALGLVTYELLVGRVPYSTSMKEVIHAKLTGEPPSLAAYADVLDARIVALVDRMLSHRLEDRPSSMNEVLESLRELGASLPRPQGDSLARTPSWPGERRSPTGPVPSSLREESRRLRVGTGPAPRAVEAEAAPVRAAPMRTAPAPWMAGAAAPTRVGAASEDAGSDADRDRELVRSLRSSTTRSLPSWRTFVVVALLGAAGTLGAFLLFGDEERPAPTPQPPPAAVAPVAPQTAAPVVAEASKPERPAARGARSDGILFSLRSEPDEAEVWVDGAHMGLTPLKVRLDPKRPPRDVRVRKAGFKEWRRALRGHGPHRLTARLVGEDGTRPAKGPAGGSGKTSPGTEPVLQDPFED